MSHLQYSVVKVVQRQFLRRWHQITHECILLLLVPRQHDIILRGIKSCLKRNKVTSTQQGPDHLTSAQ